MSSNSEKPRGFPLKSEPPDAHDEPTRVGTLDQAMLGALMDSTPPPADEATKMLSRDALAEALTPKAYELDDEEAVTDGATVMGPAAAAEFGFESADSVPPPAAPAAVTGSAPTPQAAPRPLPSAPIPFEPGPVTENADAERGRRARVAAVIAALIVLAGLVLAWQSCR